MPFTDNQGTKIYWDEEGQGAAILLIMGLGWSSDMWHRTRPVLSLRYRTIAFDNRGVGRSAVPKGPYSIADMASDAARVLDAAGVERAHLFGVSMGGMIAQEFALKYPMRIRSLILGCTSPGGPNAVKAEAEVLRILAQRSVEPEETAKAMVPFIYDPATPLARLEEDMTLRRKWFPTSEGYFAQLQGIMAWEAYSRLTQILAPTLVIHGESDKLVPATNAKLIAGRIPGAKLVTIPNASHILTTDQPETVQHAVLAFLSSQISTTSTAES
jgi:pimeloyl-ACP methyl ester carboxylesterase